MLYDRPYMRAGSHRPGKSSALKIILIAVISSFILQKVVEVWFHSDFIITHFSLASVNVSKGFIWSFLSYGLLHASTQHLILNLLGIFFIGRLVEADLGAERFLKLYLTATLFGGLLWFGLHFNDGSFLVGASAALTGILAYFCLSRWEQSITFLIFFIIPVSLKPKWIFWFLFGIEISCFLFYELSSVHSYNIAHSAHLGGLLSGFLFYYFPSIKRKLSNLRLGIKSKFKKDFINDTFQTKERPFTINLTQREEFKVEVDRILDKISAQGLASLSTYEREILDRARKHLKH